MVIITKIGFFQQKVLKNVRCNKGAVDINYFKIKPMETRDIELFGLKNFLFKIINEEFGYRYVPEYHTDIINLEDYYIKPDKNIFLLAFLKNTDVLIGTLGIRAYDKDYGIFKGIYDAESTASIWRVFIDKKWRRNGIGSKLVSIAEEFCKNKGYKNIYLHTQKMVDGSLDFWLSKGYRITKDMKNELGTVHMEKILVELIKTEEKEVYGVII